MRVDPGLAPQRVGVATGTGGGGDRHPPELRLERSRLVTARASSSASCQVGIRVLNESRARLVATAAAVKVTIGVERRGELRRVRRLGVPPTG